MLTYNPEKFASLYASNLGQRIWAFLIQPESVARLETASELSKPAVEGIEEQLLEAFREDVLADRVKQMVGHMVRQILEQRDWVLDQSDVKVQSVPLQQGGAVSAPRLDYVPRLPEYQRSARCRNYRPPPECAAPRRRAVDLLPPPSPARLRRSSRSGSATSGYCVSTSVHTAISAFRIERVLRRA